eukprot:CAMPEP_0183444104 /NCGR_PEP_ID=MMETSP0370-20130417/94019_1 /TAXON_ID=268820 /ORGANISM="Peridinium aciculiferum, Strain PAER-2" /LENGTH=84 /DNA_ID=CAMNT_0025634351 /DNA_START=188 /DNA_END=438 /DNA_ORIENTATION=+
MAHCRAEFPHDMHSMLKWQHLGMAAHETLHLHQSPIHPAAWQSCGQASSAWTARIRTAHAPPIADELADSRTAACAAARRAMGT